MFEYGIGIMIPLLLDKGFAEKTWIPLNAYRPRHICLDFEKHTWPTVSPTLAHSVSCAVGPIHVPIRNCCRLSEGY